MTTPPFNDYPPHVLARFKSWHQANPHVYHQFKTMALAMKATGRKRYSARRIVEVMRWDYDIKTTGNVFELNDNFTPIYVRLLIYHHPEFDGFFELREIRSKGVFSDEERKRRKRGDDEA